MFRRGFQVILIAASALIVQMAKVEKIIDPIKLGEGPHWDVKSQALYLVDITGNSLLKYSPQTNSTLSVRLGTDSVGFIVPVKGKPDHFVVGEKLNVVLVHWDTEQNEIVSKEVLATIDEPVQNRLNDAKCDSSGRLWLGTMSNEMTVGAGSFYSFTVKGGLKLHAKNISISNGIAYTKNNEKFYYIDSLKESVDEYDFNIAGGEISYVKAAFDYKKNNVQGLPDGMTIDEDGNLWVACYGSNQVIQVNPSQGKLLQTVKFPKAHQITSVCFGGKNLNELYVTSAATNLSEDDRKKNPETGATYKVTGLGVKGLPAADFDMDL